jgi:hypothetical protein
MASLGIKLPMVLCVEPNTTCKDEAIEDLGDVLLTLESASGIAKRCGGDASQVEWRRKETFFAAQHTARALGSVTGGGQLPSAIGQRWLQSFVVMMPKGKALSCITR